MFYIVRIGFSGREWPVMEPDGHRVLKFFSYQKAAESMQRELQPTPGLPDAQIVFEPE